MNQTKEINIKNCAYYFFDDMIDIKNFDPCQLKVDKKSYKNGNIYYIGYIATKNLSHVKVIVNPLHLIIDKVDRYIEESDGNKCLTLVFNDKNRSALKKYTEL